MTVAAVLVAAGSGTRLGRTLPKALVTLAGEPLAGHAARGLAAGRSATGERIEQLVVTAPAGHLDEVRDAVAGALVGLDLPVVVVAGGASRQASVAAALAALDERADVVLVHDAARPLVPGSLVGRVIDAVRAGHAAVVPGLAVTDTIKRVPQGTGPALPVLETVPRDELRAVQTPQGFERELLDRAHAAAAEHAHDESLAASDDARLVELAGEQVWVVAGDERAAKITTERDLAVAELLLGEERG
ncbi:2-C-methyl-D-erythritol 4-phosphate cytidylyltransferase [Actinotalea sp. M2MS4P-6]|uniref:2-C-methyl-D-erythritol 4-phosphate cytidylyltransferase n=1 Tax=Actinotalea sp. M2MS4P-6 TaxID=2983762 RepID=UPI0021E48024|nr:2-C-methyl-D-erythritol 4-phosphate cytidylyltransferase [Actinotalea sp. M2MS4P-6]MCV2395051.1 2-C-methyl-D-erythritol 4-phosphate cytidylyltransferase [Actinotalea sp. M2MS4P-6]